MRHIELFIVNGKITLGNEFMDGVPTVIRAGTIHDINPAILTIKDDGELSIKNLTSEEYFAAIMQYVKG